MYKETRWAMELIDMQKPDGSWGWFHTLSKFSDMPVTTEHALRRLKQLGYTKEDDCIRRGLDYMHECLAGERLLPDRREKRHDWDTFTELMLAANIMLFTNEDGLANAIAFKWKQVVTEACADGEFSVNGYLKAYVDVFGRAASGGRLEDPVSFYQVSMLRNCLDEATERAWFDYVMHKPDGIYYISERSMEYPPAIFQSKQAVRYLGALELLADYSCAGEMLETGIDWLNCNRRSDGRWDMGSVAKNGFNFPLSDSWRDSETRINDCTWCIERIMKKLTR